MRWLGRHWISIALFCLGLLVYGLVADKRLEEQSQDPHFALLADAWLDGRLDIDPGKRRGDDWAMVDTVVLRDGTEVQGRRLHTRKTFRVLGRGEIPVSEIVRTTGRTYHVSFPPFPAVLMLPQAALDGPRGNDVRLTWVIAALILPLLLAVLRRLRQAGLSQRTTGEDLWLVVALAFGSVLFFSAVQGRVWFTAHVIGVALALGYAWCAIEARHPVLAGLCLGCAAMTRTPLAFMFPLFAFEAWRMATSRSGGPGDPWRRGPSPLRVIERRQLLARFARSCALFAAPILLIALLAMLHNLLRFHDPLEFGHNYLDVRQQGQMETVGMFSYDYLGRNLAVAFALLPEFTSREPHVTISGHGLAIWVTTPLVLWVLWPRVKNALHRPLWLTVALVATPSLLYQNSGWLQFGYRFSLDYLPFLFLLVAIGGRSLRRLARALIIVSIAINLFGAVTFGRLEYLDYYRAQRAAYGTVIAH